MKGTEEKDGERNRESEAPEGGTSRAMSPVNDPTDAGRQEEPPILRTMNREKPYPLGMSRVELDRRRRLSLAKTSEFSFAKFPDEKPAQFEDEKSRRDEHQDLSRQVNLKQSRNPGKRSDYVQESRPSSDPPLDAPFIIQVSQRVTSPLSPEGMGLTLHQPGSDSSTNLNDQHMNRTTEGQRSLPIHASVIRDHGRLIADETLRLPFNDLLMSESTGREMMSARSDLSTHLPEPESREESYSDLFTQDVTVESSPEVQTPKWNDRPPSLHEAATEEDSSSMDSDGYPLATHTSSHNSNSNYRRRSSLGISPLEESNFIREWRMRKREELEEKSRKSEESHRQILDTAQKEVKSFYAERSAELQARKRINREKERVFNAVHNIGKDSKMPLNLWEVVVTMLPPASTAERFKSSGNRTPSTTPATPQNLMTPSTFFSHHISTAPSATPSKQGTTNPKHGKDVNKDTNSTTTGEEVENIAEVKVTDICRMRQILIKLKDKPPDIFRNDPDFL